MEPLIDDLFLFENEKAPIEADKHLRNRAQPEVTLKFAGEIFPFALFTHTYTHKQDKEKTTKIRKKEGKI